jgi:hypothetical protein
LKLKSKVLAGASALAMASGLISVAAPAAHAVVTNVGTCENAVQLVTLTTPTKGVGLGDQTVDNVKAAGNLAKDQTSKLVVNGGGTCSGVTPHGDKHIPFPPSGPNVVSGLTAKSAAVSITGNASCASDAPNMAIDATAANAYPLHGKITWTFNQTYVDLITAFVKPYKMQVMVQVLGFNPGFLDVIDVGGIVLSGVNAGAAVSGQVWFDPVAKTGGATGYNTGYEIDLVNASGCADAVPVAGNANITKVLSGSGLATPSLLGSAVPGLSFDFGEPEEDQWALIASVPERDSGPASKRGGSARVHQRILRCSHRRRVIGGMRAAPPRHRHGIIECRRTVRESVSRLIPFGPPRAIAGQHLGLTRR